MEQLEGATVAEDLRNLISLLGADLQSTWGKSGNEKTSDAWKYCSKLDQDI